jgi:uncharacterized glyoxalase superfamily protein PhnB
VAIRKKTGAKKPAAKTAGKTRGARISKPAARSAVPKRKEPQTLRLRAITPGLTVNDIARSVAWYRDVLGFIVAEEWRAKGVLRGAEMKAGAVSLFLGQDDWKKGTDRSKGAGFRLYCTTAQDVDRLAALVKSRGGVLAHEPQTQPWGERDFGLVDPDGFNLTITGG